ncbi:MAG TPA: DUF58 domain-containing protein [Stackebrandtia sp.]|jgi:uncharacterized protein (DUF58 family)|uniref:DUF58 domain-containing protein n=1 Tax=Stackebrandtia sp. TaxID=2023065 RepID=UPI002D314C90|nr:DUF58 domain-containing protein [Stackebrandtia sp.]HZE41319.1 DUF58 domain-containing protein [Stackebrandtia sp.]
MREALGALTIRGKSLVAVGISLLLLSMLIGEKDLMRAAVLVGLLPVISALVLARTRYRITTARVLDPMRVEAGQHARVTLRLRNEGRTPTGSMMLEDRLPYALGSRPRLVLEKLLAGGGSAVSYSVHADHRGRYDIGPLIVRLSDPFGLIELTRSYPSSDHLTVTPQIVALPPVRLPGEYAGNGENRSRAVSVHGEDDAAIREYRHGDDLRRVHWPSTAHRGELMVRREEQPWDSRATILLDERAAAYRGEGPSSSFEWAVSAAASINTHLLRSGYKLRMVSESIDAEPDASGDGLLMDYLAGVRTNRHGSMDRMVAQVRRRDHGGLIVAVVGTMTPDEAERLAGLHTSGATCVALLIDSTTWLKLPAASRAEMDRVHHDVTINLLRNGWRVIPIRNGDNLAHQWRALAQGPQGFAYRAAMAETVSGATKGAQ